MVVTDLLISSGNGSNGFVVYPISKESPINITYQLIDVREPDKRKGSRSLTILLYGTNEINKLFENAFSVNVVTQNFNKNLKTPCKYIVDGIENFSGDLQLLKVNINADKNIEYECSIIGESGSIFLEIGEKLITGNPDTADNLDFSAYDHTYNRANQISTRSNYGTGLGVLYPFIDKGSNGGSDTVFSVEDFLPCFHKHEYIKKIIEKAGYTYTSSILDSTEFKKQITYPNITDVSLSQSQIDNRQFYVGLSADQNIPNNNEQGMAYTNSSTSGFFDLGSQLDGGLDLVILNSNGNYNIATQNFVSYKITHTDPDVAFWRANVVLGSKINKSGNGGASYFVIAQQPSFLMSTASAKVPVNTFVDGTGGVATGSQFFSAGDYIRPTFYLEFVNIEYFDSMQLPITPSGGTFATITRHLVSGGGKTSFYAICSSKTIIAGDTIEVNNALLLKTKQKDYLKSIIQGLNLFIEPDKNNPKNLIIESFKEFYDYEIIDCENLTDLSKQQSINPNILDGKKYIYNYKEDKDKYNELYKNEFNEVFGTHTVEVENDFIKSEKKNELIFSATPNVANYGLGIAHPRIYKEESGVKKPIAANIRWLICGGVKQSLNQITYKEYGQPDLISNDYLYAGHTDDPFNPTVDLNFGTPKRVYYDFIGAYFTTNNLFNRYHKSYLKNLIDRDGKFVTKNLWLSPKFINQFSFRQRLFIDGSYYIVNKIENYNPTVLGSTNTELIKLLESDVFNPESFLISSDPTISGGVDAPVERLNSSISAGNGIQNKGTNCVAIGDYIIIPASCSNVTVIGNNISVPENTNDFSYINGQVTNTVLNEKALIQNVSANYNVKAYDDVVFMTTGATDKTVTLTYNLPEYLDSSIVLNINDVETTLQYTKRITINKVDSGAGNVIIDGDGALINGAATATITIQYESVTLQWDGTNWNII